MKTSSKRILIVILLIILIVAFCSQSKAQGTPDAPTNLPDSVVLSTDALDILANPYTDYFTKEDYRKVMSGYRQFVLYADKANPFVGKGSIFLKSFKRLRTFPFKATYQTQHLELTKQNDGSLLIVKAADPPKTKTFIMASIWIGLCFLIVAFFLFSYLIYCLPDKNDRDDLDWFIPWDHWDWEDYGAINAICTIALASIAVLFIGTTMVGPSYDFKTAGAGVIVLLIAAAMAGFVGYILHPLVGLLFRLVGEIVALLIKAAIWIAVKAYFWICKPLWKLIFSKEKRTSPFLEVIKVVVITAIFIGGIYLMWAYLEWSVLAGALAMLIVIVLGEMLYRHLSGKNSPKEKKGPETAGDNKTENK